MYQTFCLVDISEIKEYHKQFHRTLTYGSPIEDERSVNEYWNMNDQDREIASERMRDREYLSMLPLRTNGSLMTYDASTEDERSLNDF
jgi:hypothetical protein